MSSLQLLRVQECSSWSPTSSQLARYRQDGFLFLPAHLDELEMAALRSEAAALLLAQDSPGRVLEERSGLVRAIHGCHLNNALCARLVRHPRVLGAVQPIVGTDVYVHQFKINAKPALAGGEWPWHQDFIYMQRVDGIPVARAVSVVVFLDEVSEFNSPLWLVPGSHLEGTIDVPAREPLPTPPEARWLENFSRELKFVVDQADLSRLVERGGLVAPKGPPGSVLFFDVQLVHGSAANMSPFDRRLAITIYNSVTATPRDVAEPRPEWLAGRDFTPLVVAPGPLY